MLTVNPSVPAKDLKSFIALLKANPGKYTYASSGQGTTLHIAAEHFVTAAGVNVVHVPYKGEAPAHDRSRERPGRVHGRAGVDRRALCENVAGSSASA